MVAGPQPSDIRFRVEPGDVPADKAARRLHLTLAKFEALLPALLERGFPGPDPTTGMYDLNAIDLWRSSRHGKRNALTAPAVSPQPVLQNQMSMSERFVAARERQTQKRRRHRGAA